jgi:Family of unknown function (DUF6525)
MRNDYKLRCEAKMRAFDRLPKIVRRALTASQFNWDVEELLAAYREHRMSARQLVQHIRDEDRWRLEDRQP